VEASPIRFAAHIGGNNSLPDGDKIRRDGTLRAVGGIKLTDGVPRCVNCLGPGRISHQCSGYLGQCLLDYQLPGVNIDFVSSYIKSAISAGFWLLGEYFSRQSGIEDPKLKLPRYWNDPIPPQTGQIPTNLIPAPPTSSLDEPPAATGSETGEIENTSSHHIPKSPARR
jgi:hypothetical protein